MRGLKLAREAASLTQEQVAKALGVTDVTVSRWETGAREPDIDMLRRLSVLLHVGIDALVASSVEEVAS